MRVTAATGGRPGSRGHALGVTAHAPRPGGWRLHPVVCESLKVTAEFPLTQVSGDRVIAFSRPTGVSRLGFEWQVGVRAGAGTRTVTDSRRKQTARDGLPLCEACNLHLINIRTIYISLTYATTGPWDSSPGSLSEGITTGL